MRKYNPTKAYVNRYTNKVSSGIATNFRIGRLLIHYRDGELLIRKTSEKNLENLIIKAYKEL